MSYDVADQRFDSDFVYADSADAPITTKAAWMENLRAGGGRPQPAPEPERKGLFSRLGRRRQR